MADPGFVDIDRNAGGLGNALRPLMGLGQSPRRGPVGETPRRSQVYQHACPPPLSLSLMLTHVYTPLIESK